MQIMQDPKEGQPERDEPLIGNREIYSDYGSTKNSGKIDESVGDRSESNEDFTNSTGPRRSNDNNED